MEATASAPTSSVVTTVADAQPSTLRRIVTVAFIVLSSLLVFVGSTTVWASRTLFNTDKFTALMETVVTDPEVQQAISVTVADRSVDYLVESGAFDQLLPPVLDPVQGLITGALRAQVANVTAKVLALQQTQDLLVGSIRKSHGAAMAVLRGDAFSSDVVTIRDDQVVLDLRPVVVRVFEELERIGIVKRVPTVDDLPTAIGDLVVYQGKVVADASATVTSARRMLTAARRATILLVIVTLLTIAVTLVIAADRRRAAMGLAIGTIAAFLVSRALVRRVVDAVPKLVTSPDAQQAVHNVLASFADGLQRLQLALIVLGILVVLVGVALGPSKVGTAARVAAAQHPEALAGSTVVVVGLLILGFGLSWAAVLLTVVTVASAVTVMRAGQADSPAATGATSTDAPAP